MRALQLIAALFNLAQNVLRVFDYLPYRVCVGGVERQGYHRLDAREVYRHGAVVVGGLFGVEFLEVPLPAVNFKEFLGGFVRLPYAGKAGRFGGHYVDAQAVVH